MAKTNVIVTTEGKSKALESLCISIAFYRPTGSNPFTINGIPVEDGKTLTINQNVGDFDITKYQLVFQAGAGDNECYVIKIVPDDVEAYLNGGK